MSRLYKKNFKSFYRNLNITNVLDNKNFWKNIKPLFSDKSPKDKTIAIVHENEVYSDDKEVSELLNQFFKDAVTNLQITENRFLLNNTDSLCEDTIDNAINKFEFHPSILKIKEKVILSTFNFIEPSLDEVEKEIKALNPKKANTFNNIPTKILKENVDIFCPVLYKLVVEAFQTGVFPDELKLADITPTYKKEDPTNTKHYRPISVLPTVSKIFERLIQKQLSSHFNQHLSHFFAATEKALTRSMR